KHQLSYRDVLNAQQQIADVLQATAEAKPEDRNVNSLVRLLQITAAEPAKVEHSDRDPFYQLIHSELAQIRSELRTLKNQASQPQFRHSSPATVDIGPRLVVGQTTTSPLLSALVGGSPEQRAAWEQQQHLYDKWMTTTTPPPDSQSGQP